MDKRPPYQEFGGFLTLDVVVPVHESLELEAESLYDRKPYRSNYVFKRGDVLH
ncbi:MAG: hypothetical protein P4L58_05100 [Candidatus Pacebacteria bacterium]|nr:hypothetical protein [Candidatus Paceibacterota bacterium]